MNDSLESSVNLATEVQCESFVLTCIYAVTLFCSIYSSIHPTDMSGKEAYYRKVFQGKSFLGRPRAKNWEGLCQGKKIWLKILILGGWGSAVQTLAVGTCSWGHSLMGGSSKCWKHTKNLPPLQNARQSPKLHGFTSQLLLLAHPLCLKGWAQNYPKAALLPGSHCGRQRCAQPLAPERAAGGRGRCLRGAERGCFWHSAPPSLPQSAWCWWSEARLTPMSPSYLPDHRASIPDAGGRQGVGTSVRLCWLTLPPAASLWDLGREDAPWDLAIPRHVGPAWETCW